MTTTKNNRSKLVTIFDYAKLPDWKKINMIRKCALFIEHFFDGEKSINVYLLNSFFIEVTKGKERLIDIIPYKRGYALKHAF